MDGDGKKPLKIAVLEFYKLNSKKEKSKWTTKPFKWSNKFDDNILVNIFFVSI